MRIVALDTGNRLIKTPHFSFNAGIVRLGRRPPALKTDMLCFDDEYFTITEQRSPYLKDKTVDDTYFLLSLFAIGKELTRASNTQAGMDIREQLFLAVGLPPSHLPLYKDSYAEYFTSRGKTIQFKYNSRSLSVEISRVSVFPQGFSAAYNLLDQVSQYPRSYIVDIGGYTTDVILLSYGKPDMSFCHSFNFGVIHMDNELKRVISARNDVELEDAHIESALRGNQTLPAPIIEMIQQGAASYAENLVRNLEERGVSPAVNMLIFLGGGAELFRDVLTRKCPNTIFQTDIRANAIGYAKLASALSGIPYTK